MKICIVDGCGNNQHPKAAKGMCRKHYDKLLKYGDPLHKQSRKIIDNPKYSTVHKNLVKYRGKASDYQCAQCNSMANQWACQDNKTEYEIINGYTIYYSNNLNDYAPLCYSCHRTIDKKVRPLLCKRGHNNWYEYTNKYKRYCKTCAKEIRGAAK